MLTNLYTNSDRLQNQNLKKLRSDIDQKLNIQDFVVCLAGRMT